MARCPNTQSRLQVEMVDLASITPYPNNAKQHPEYQVNQIVNSIQEFGFNDPIAVDSDNVIIEGHGRALAAQKLNLVQVPIIRLGHLTEAQKKLYILAHNKINMTTGFNIEMVQSELDYISDLDPSLELSLAAFDEYNFNAPDLSDTGTTSHIQAAEAAGKDYIRIKCFVSDKNTIIDHLQRFIQTLDIEGVELG